METKKRKRGNPLVVKRPGATFGFRINRELKMRLFQLAALEGVEPSAIVLELIRAKMSDSMERIVEAEAAGKFDPEVLRTMLEGE